MLSQPLICRNLSIHILIVKYDLWIKQNLLTIFRLMFYFGCLKEDTFLQKCLEIPEALVSLASPTDFSVLYWLLVSIGWWALWRNFNYFLELLHPLARKHYKGQMVKEIIIIVNQVLPSSCPKEMIVALHGIWMNVKITFFNKKGQKLLIKILAQPPLLKRY